MPSCAIDMGQRLFRCSHLNFFCKTHEKIRKFVSETCEKRSQEYFISESRGAPNAQNMILSQSGFNILPKTKQTSYDWQKRLRMLLISPIMVTLKLSYVLLDFIDNPFCNINRT